MVLVVMGGVNGFEVGFVGSFVPLGGRQVSLHRKCGVRMAAGGGGTVDEPILLRAARGEKVERPPVWLMRQAGRYMADFRKYSEKYAFRKRSETPEIGM